jgi:hypothetical protein
MMGAFASHSNFLTTKPMPIFVALNPREWGIPTTEDGSTERLADARSNSTSQTPMAFDGTLSASKKIPRLRAGAGVLKVLALFGAKANVPEA